MATIFEISAKLGTVYLLEIELHLIAFATNNGKTAYKILCIHITMHISKQKRNLNKLAAISEADNKRFKATMIRAKLGFRLQMVINFDSDVAKQAFCLVRIIAAQL